MAAGCGAMFAKVMLIIFNIMFLCTGLILMALGIWLLVILGQNGLSDVFSLSGNSNTNLFRASAGLLLAMGCAIVLITILGLVAAIKESVVLLSIYLALILIIFGGEIAGGVVAIVYKDVILNQLENTLWNSLNFTQYPYYSNTTVCSSQQSGLLWDRVQLYFSCCGLDDGSGSGYGSAMNFSACTNAKTTVAPVTCCSIGNATAFQYWNYNYANQASNSANVDCTNIGNTEGCVTKVSDFIVRYSPVLIGIGIGFAMLELFGVIFTVCLCRNPSKGFQQF